ncbi:MAG TPA: DUF3617 domain-containing protein [Acidobacteriaceae bacterium]|nr:DUF3617 domain-containing protein [Acidobacteriaceae bacterium]
MFLNRIQGCLLLVCVAGVAGAQTAVNPDTPPPVKMGLWETQVTSQIAGITLPPDVIARLKQMGRPIPGEAHTTVTQSCLTPEEWRKSLEGMNKPQNSDCTIDKREVNEKKFSFDLSCKTERGMTMTGHWEMNVVDDEHAHGSGSMTGDQPGPNGQNFSATTTIDSHYLGASCGDVKPGEPKVVQH